MLLLLVLHRKRTLPLNSDVAWIDAEKAKYLTLTSSVAWSLASICLNWSVAVCLLWFHQSEIP